jgi:hypothetical protein
MAASKKAAKPKFTSQMKLILILDVEIEGGSLPESIELSKTWKRADLIAKLDEAVSVVDERLECVGVWSDSAWSTE